MSTLAPSLDPPNAPRRRFALWTGRALTGAFVVFMLGASIAPKLLGAEVAGDTLEALGWDRDRALLIGVIELVCVALVILPRTALLGAVLTTALLGGAMATQLRVDSPLFTHILFSLYLGLFLWGGLWLRDSRLRRLFPLSSRERPAAGDRTPDGGAVR